MANSSGTGSTRPKRSKKRSDPSLKPVARSRSKKDDKEIPANIAKNTLEGGKTTPLKGEDLQLTVDKIKKKLLTYGVLEPIKGYSPNGRKQRKAGERPRPDLPASAPVNRTKKQVNLSLGPELLEAVNGAAKERNVDRNSLIEHAIRLYLDIK